MVENALWIINKSTEVKANKLISFGWRFRPGEIKRFPQVLINGRAVTTQANVDQVDGYGPGIRHKDGSVAFAHIAFYLPKITPSQRVKITFRNQRTAGTANALTTDSLLKEERDFDAEINYNFQTGTTASVNARKIIEDGNYVYWLRGRFVSSVLCVDHSENRAYDVGADDHRSVRPSFEITFTKDNECVYFGNMIENSEALQDQVYDFSLSFGHQNKRTVYQKAGYVNHAAAGWDREFWTKTNPQDGLQIDFNFEYQKELAAIWNFTKIAVPDERVQAYYDNYNALPHDVGEPGLWKPAMGTGGDHDALGYSTEWEWLYFQSNFDPRLREILYNQVSLYKSFPLFLRESKFQDRPFNKSGDGTPAYGRHMSIVVRPSFSTRAWAWKYTNEDERIHFVGPAENHPYVPDIAHNRPGWMWPYYETCRHHYLELGQFVHAWMTCMPAGSTAAAQPYGRGVDGTDGALTREQDRSTAWMDAERLFLDWMCPPSPEKDYVSTCLEEGHLIEEGACGLTEGNRYSDWGRDVVRDRRGVHPLGIYTWGNEGPGLVSEDKGLDINKASWATINWHIFFILAVYKHGEHMGYPLRKLVEFLSKNVIAQLTDPDMNPYLIGAGHFPTVKVDGTPTTNYREVLDCYLPDWQTRGEFFTRAPAFAVVYAIAALAAAAEEPDGSGLPAYGWFKENYLDKCEYLNPIDPTVPVTGTKWALGPKKLPRT